MNVETEIKTSLKQDKPQKAQKIDGVVIGLLLSINEKGQPLVAYAGNPKETAIPARSTAQLE